ncbi:MAG: hypothetical protein J5689_02645 [Clostridia bacterium]|nr:hypothetical protein [Clostridia bacterium]
MGKFLDRRANKSNKNIIAGVLLIVLGACGLLFSILYQTFIGKFLVGVLGILSYPTFLLVAVIGIATLLNQRFNFRTRSLVYLTLDIIALFCVLHSIFSLKNFSGFSEAVSSAYYLTYGMTFGGVIFAVLTGAVAALLGQFGTIILFSILFCILVGLTIDDAIYNKNRENLTASSKRFDNFENDDLYKPVVKNSIQEEPETIETIEPEENNDEEENPAKTILFGAGNNYNSVNQEDDENENKSAHDILFGNRKNPDNFSSTDEERRTWINNSSNQPSRNNYSYNRVDNYNQYDEDNEEESRQNARNVLFNSNPYSVDNDEQEDEDYSGLRSRAGFRNRRVSQEDDEDEQSNISFVNPYQSQAEEDEEEQPNVRPRSRFRTDLTSNSYENEQNIGSRFNQGASRFDRRIFGQPQERVEQTEIDEVKVPEKPAKPVIRDVRYNPPPVTLLKESKDDPSKYAKNYQENSRIIEEKLETFKIPAKVVNVVRGPSVTRYELEMPSGIPVKNVLRYDSDLSMALKCKQTIRIEAPIPGKNAIGIETPNDPRSTVTLRELIESKEFSSSSMALPIAIGKNISGEVVVKNLAKLVHVLVAGSTGSGKSVFLHSVIMSLMFKLSPSELRFIMVDPKRVEFNRYKGMPHMMLSDVVSDPAKAVKALSWAVSEMERRYQVLEEHKCRDLASFNQCDAVKNGEIKKMPYLVIIVDELAELMSVAKKDVEYCIRRISQLGRASGIHLVLATQRPSVEIITGTIKANLPNRIAFALTSYIDSKTILDEPGAEKLLGQGDMLFSPQESNTPIRLQAAYVSDEEIDRCVEFIKRNNATEYDEEVEKQIYAEDKQQNEETSVKEPVDRSAQVDELLPAALKLFIESKKGSISMVQRRFCVGYARAARIVDQMEQMGYISASEGSKNREVLINLDEFRQIYGDEDY